MFHQEIFPSSIGIKSDCWQIEIDKHDREKTFFMTLNGLCELQVMIFGLCRTLRKVIGTALAALRSLTCLVYLHVVVVFCDTLKEHRKRLTTVQNVLREAGLSLQPEKCGFKCPELKLLGSLASTAGVRPYQEKASVVASVANFPTSKNKKQVRSFLELCCYHRRFVSNVSKTGGLLTKGDKTFIRGAGQQRVLEELKNRLVTSPVLCHFDPHAKANTAIHTDACN